MFDKIRDLEYKYQCIICGNNRPIDYEKATWLFNLHSPFKIVRCNHCDLLWLNPRPTADEYKKIYNSESYFVQDEGMLESSEMRAFKHKKHFQNRIKKIKKILYGLCGMKLLDIGSATGEFVALCRSSGIEATGLETSTYAVGTSREKYGNYFYHGELKSLPLNLKESTFDVVHLNHTFEHLLDPEDSLKRISELLTNKGIVVIEVPNEFDNILDLFRYCIGIAKPKRYDLHSLHHPFFYSPKSISLLLSKTGYTIISFKTYLASSVIESEIIGGQIIKRLLLRFGDILLKNGNIIEVIARKL